MSEIDKRPQVRERQELEKLIKQFMYDSSLHDDSFRDADVISPAYFLSVLTKAYSDHDKIKPYSMISGDFNKLNDLNMKYGYEEGDRCIKEAIHRVMEMLPQGTQTCRYGGDEFIFILPKEYKQKELDRFMKNMHAVLEQYSEELHGLTIGLGGASSRGTRSISELYANIDEKINKEKLRAKQKDAGKNFFKNFQTFFSSMRLSNDFRFEVRDMETILKSCISANGDMLASYIAKGTTYIPPEDGQMMDASYYDFLDKSSMLTTEEAIFLNQVFSQEEIDEELVKQIPIEKLDQAAKEMVYSYSRSAFTYNYFKEYIMPKMNQDKRYKFYLFSLSGLKLSNLIYGHKHTDKFMYDNVYSNLVDNVDGKNRLEKRLFYFDDSRIFKVNIGGGDIVYIVPEGQYFDYDIEAFNEQNRRMRILRYVVKPSKGFETIDHMPEILDDLDQEAKVAKDGYKRDILKDEILLSKVLQISLSSTIEKYIKGKEDFLNIDTFRGILETEAGALLEYKEKTEKRDKIERIRDLVIGSKEKVPVVSKAKKEMQPQFAGINILDEDRDEDI